MTKSEWRLLYRIAKSYGVRFYVAHKAEAGLYTYWHFGAYVAGKPIDGELLVCDTGYALRYFWLVQGDLHDVVKVLVNDAQWVLDGLPLSSWHRQPVAAARAASASTEE